MYLKFYRLFIFILIFSMACQSLSIEDDSGESEIVVDEETGIVLWGDINNDYGHAVVQTADGGYAVAGTQYSTPNQHDLYLIKFDPTGQQEGTEFFLDKEGFDNQANDLRVTQDGGFVLVGNSFNGSFEEAWVVKLNASMISEWDSTYTYPASTGNNVGNSIEQTDDGGYIVCGSAFLDNDYEIWLMKLNSDGTKAWDKVFDTDASNIYHDYGNYAHQTDDGGYILVGSSFDSDQNYDIRLIKTDQNGDSVWDSTYSRASGYYSDKGLYVQQSDDGQRYIIAGTTSSIDGNQSDIYIFKTDYQGTVIDSKTFGSSFHDEAKNIRQTSDGGFIVIGTKFSDQTLEDVYAIKINIDLVEEWSSIYGYGNSDIGTSIQQTSDGGYIMTGSSYDPEKQFEIILIKTDQDGDTEILGSTNN